VNSDGAVFVPPTFRTRNDLVVDAIRLAVFAGVGVDGNLRFWKNLPNFVMAFAITVISNSESRQIRCAMFY